MHRGTDRGGSQRVGFDQGLDCGRSQFTDAVSAVPGELDEQLISNLRLKEPRVQLVSQPRHRLL